MALYQVLSGAEFNEQFKKHKFVKLTSNPEIHNGFEFKTGYNIDTIKFNPKGSCNSGGIYFTDINKMAIWLNYGNGPMMYAREVTIPEDSQIYIEEDKYKIDKLILG